MNSSQREIHDPNKMISRHKSQGFWCAFASSASFETLDQTNPRTTIGVGSCDLRRSSFGSGCWGEGIASGRMGERGMGRSRGGLAQVMDN